MLGEISRIARVGLCATLSIVAFHNISESASTSTAKPVYNKPIYDPASKSYFELVKLTKGDDADHYLPSMNWSNAEAFARRRAYKGALGRLATIKAGDTHFFILTSLRPSTFTWIGLRYSCDTQKFRWSDGTALVEEFQAWHATWNQSGESCLKGSFMGVAYTPISDGFRWVAKGRAKLYTDLLVEYPTGAP
jgi:hypothetical protein